jgi:hypothetical protein
MASMSYHGRDAKVHDDPILAASFNLLAGWFARGDGKQRNWNETEALAQTFGELKDLNYWWTVLRPGRPAPKDQNEMVAYHRVDSDQLIRLIKVREFLIHPNLQQPIYPLSCRPEMDFIQFRTDDLALEVCRRGTVAAAVVISQDDTTGPDRFDMTYWARGDTPLNKVRAVNALMKCIIAQAEEQGCTSEQIDRAMGISDMDY